MRVTRRNRVQYLRLMSSPFKASADGLLRQHAQSATCWTSNFQGELLSARENSQTSCRTAHPTTKKHVSSALPFANSISTMIYDDARGVPVTFGGVTGTSPGHQPFDKCAQNSHCWPNQAKNRCLPQRYPSVLRGRKIDRKHQFPSLRYQDQHAGYTGT
jgi:hypothetical protein